MPGVAANGDSISVQVGGPFDLPLSLAAAASFFPITGPAPVMLVSPVSVDGSMAAVTISLLRTKHHDRPTRRDQVNAELSWYSEDLRSAAQESSDHRTG